jgi:hypothetical protein
MQIFYELRRSFRLSPLELFGEAAKPDLLLISPMREAALMDSCLAIFQQLYQ